MNQVKATHSTKSVWHIFLAGVSRQRSVTANTPLAVKSAYQEFQKTEAEWANSLFDETFLCQDAAPLFANGAVPTAKRLATAWRNQFNVGTAAQKAADIKKMEPAAAVFLQMVRRELRG